MAPPPRRGCPPPPPRGTRPRARAPPPRRPPRDAPPPRGAPPPPSASESAPGATRRWSPRAEPDHVLHPGRARSRSRARGEPAPARHQQPLRDPGALEPRRRVERDQLAVHHEADAAAVLRLVEVVRRHEDGRAAAREVADDAPEGRGARPGPRRRSARRGTPPGAAAGSRRQARAAGGSRRAGRR